MAYGTQLQHPHRKTGMFELIFLVFYSSSDLYELDRYERRALHQLFSLLSTAHSCKHGKAKEE